MLLNSECCEVRVWDGAFCTSSVSRTRGNETERGERDTRRQHGRERAREGMVDWVRATVPALSVSVLHIMACTSLNTAATGN